MNVYILSAKVLLFFYFWNFYPKGIWTLGRGCAPIAGRHGKLVSWPVRNTSSNVCVFRNRFYWPCILEVCVVNIAIWTSTLKNASGYHLKCGVEGCHSCNAFHKVFLCYNLSLVSREGFALTPGTASKQLIAHFSFFGAFITKRLLPSYTEWSLGFVPYPSSVLQHIVLSQQYVPAKKYLRRRQIRCAAISYF